MIQIVFNFRNLRLKEYEVLLSKATLPENIKWCKFFIFKRISYIISRSFDILKFERIKHLSKTIKIKEWTPKDHDDRLIVSSSSRIKKKARRTLI
ncbi:hypothetical protein H5410_056822 [Solanum commersonii]|uniref:Uncharacterized protein n=1 Tax=Solanum commersonii TaxID=4109 RepID=A0A9J5WNT6_SOLCO|nr:hypothetical protein H5410_056822 [Solanum commersonii]